MSLCRICLDEEPDVFQSIYSKKDDILIADIFTAFGCEINRNEKMPKYICLPCSENILSCYNIFLKVRNSDQYLRNLNKLPLTNYTSRPEKNIEAESISTQTEDTEYTEIPENQIEEFENISETVEIYEPVDEIEHPHLTPSEDEKFNVLEEEIEFIEDQLIEEKILKTEFFCSICNQKFGDESELFIHLSNHNSSDDADSSPKRKKRDRPYVCSVCCKAFLTKQNLQAHKICHEDKKEFNCSVCSKSFLRKGDLDIHMVSHSNNRPFHCELCPMTFKTKAHWNLHQKVHTKEKPYDCNLCGQSFGNYSDRKTHMLAHEGIHPFKCPDCGKNYGRNARLQDHIRRHHSGERPFSCESCDKKFVQNWELMAHKKKNHEK